MMACTQHKDGNRFYWRIPEGNKAEPSPAVDIWWNRLVQVFKGKRVQAEVLVLRQVTEEADRADVITLPLGQVYDLIDALNRAVENP